MLPILLLLGLRVAVLLAAEAVAHADSPVVRIPRVSRPQDDRVVAGHFSRSPALLLLSANPLGIQADAITHEGGDDEHSFDRTQPT